MKRRHSFTVAPFWPDRAKQCSDRPYAITRLGRWCKGMGIGKFPLHSFCGLLRSCKLSSLWGAARPLNRLALILPTNALKRNGKVVALLLLLTLFLGIYFMSKKAVSSVSFRLSTFPSHLLPSTQPTPAIVILLVLKSQAQLDHYKPAVDTLHCYAGVQNYSFHIAFVDDSAGRCGDGREQEERGRDEYQGDFMFRRHCTVAWFMMNHPHYDYVLFVESNIGVINPTRRIEEFIDADEGVSLVFFESENTCGISPGSYLARNTWQARHFISYFADYVYELEEKAHITYYQPGYLKSRCFDSTSLMAVFMHMFATRNETAECNSYLFDYRHAQFLDQFVACTRHYLRMHHTARWWNRAEYYHNEEVGLVKVLPRYGAWVRDAIIGGSTGRWDVGTDFMLRIEKKEQGGAQVSSELRIASRSPQTWTAFFASEAPFHADKCQAEHREQVIKRYWKERWRKNLIDGEEVLETIHKEQRQRMREYCSIDLAAVLSMNN